MANSEREPDYESRQNDILQYVRQNPNSTKADVIRHMLGRSALTTTHAILKDMTRDGKLNVYKKNLQTHLLTVNEKNEFNQIISWLDKLESISEKIIKILNKISSLSRKDEKFFILQGNLSYTYLGSIKEMAEQLLFETHYTVPDEKDKLILSSRITNLIIKMINHIYSAKFSIIAFGKDRRIVQPGAMSLATNMLNGLWSLREYKQEKGQDPIDYAIEKGIIKDDILNELHSIIHEFREYEEESHSKQPKRLTKQ